MKHSDKSHLRLILHFLMVLCVVGILYSVFVLFSDRMEYAKGDDIYKQLSLLGELGDYSTNYDSTLMDTSGEASSGEKKEQQINGVDFISLEKINPDVVGWLAAEGTEINYPVVQGKDNDFYLTHLFTGERNKLGSIFMDYRNHNDFSDKNTIIYGHNMKDGSMFSSLTNYKDQEYYDRFPTMLLFTPNGNYMIEFFAGNIVDGNYDSVRFDFKDDYDFQNYVDSLKKKSTFESNTIVKSDDRIITLVTCSYEYDNARYTLYGKLTPIKNQ